MTASEFNKGIRRILSKITKSLARTFGLGGHEWITSASSATEEKKYHWIVAKEETTLTYTDCITGTEHTKTIPQFFEIGGTLTDISVASGEILAYRI